MRSASLLLAALCVLSLVCLSTAQVAPWLDVRTVEHVVVVAGGGVDPHWTVQDPHAARDYEYAQLIVSLAAHAPPTSTVTLTYAPSTPSVVTMTLLSESATITNGTIGQMQSKTQCVANGLGTITVTLVLPGYTALQWAYTKLCTVPLISVGSFPWDRDVLDRSVVVPSYAAWTVTEDQYTLWFFLDNVLPAGDSLGQPFEIDVNSAVDGNVQAATIAYNSTYPGGVGTEAYWMQDRSQPVGMLTVLFACAPATGETLTNITVTLWYHYAEPLSFVFLKQCKTNINLFDLSVGSRANTSDIAAVGRVTPAWQAPVGFVYAPNAITNAVFQFHLCLGCQSPQGNYQVIDYTVAFDNTNTDVYDVIVRQGGTAGVLPQYADIPVYADVLCKSNGTGATNWELSLGPQYELVRFTFTYQCVFPLIDVALGSATNMIAVKTNVLPQYATYGAWHSSAGEGMTTLYIYLDAANNPTVLPAQFYSHSFTWDGAVMNEPLWLDPSNEGQAPYLNAGYVPLNIEWACRANQANSPVTLSIRYGWYGINTMQFALTKDCATPGLPDEPSSPGMSPAGIFFLVVFLITLVGCFAGCGWNYTREGKRGLHIVPLYETCAGCYDKARGTNRRWTPQMETQSSGRQAASYGADDDSGASYQQNL